MRTSKHYRENSTLFNECSIPELHFGALEDDFNPELFIDIVFLYIFITDII